MLAFRARGQPLRCREKGEGGGPKTALMGLGGAVLLGRINAEFTELGVDHIELTLAECLDRRLKRLSSAGTQF